MAYNTYYPSAYQPMQYYPQMQSNPTPAPQQTPQQNSGIIWVQGEAGAKSYLVAPNTSVALWDSESQTVYIKSADASGMPSMRVLEYVFKTDTETVKAPIQSGFVTKRELDVLRGEIAALKAQIEKGAEE